VNFIVLGCLLQKTIDFNDQSDNIHSSKLFIAQTINHCTSEQRIEHDA